VLQPVKEKVRAGAKLAKPEWANRLERLRKALNLSGAAFAQRLGTTSMSISRWERGLVEPPAEAYLVAGKLAGDPDCWFFWEMAGLTRTDIATVVPDLEQRLYKRDGKTEIEVIAARGATRSGSLLELKKKPDAVAVPLLKDAAAAGSPRLIDQASVEDVLIVPRKYCPHPDFTTCIRVTGDSMRPVLEEGYIVAVDTAQIEPKELIEKMVAARDPDGGITIKWLRKVRDDFLLVPQNTSTRHQPVILSKEPGWKIVGKVVWCLFQAP
jgi:SOS-response transcriptional repressor LexA